MPVEVDERIGPPILLKKSAVLGRKPDDLMLGELALGFNSQLPRLWFKNSDGSIQHLNRDIATLEQARAGTDNETIITPKLLAQVLSGMTFDISGSVDGGDVNGQSFIDGGSPETTQFATQVDGGLI